MRTFIGLPLPEDTSTDLERIAMGAGVGRVIPAENLHLTLSFLEKQSPSVLATLDAELAMIHAKAPDLEWSQPDILGGARTRVFALTVQPAPELLGLHTQVVRAVRGVGIDLPGVRFRPHVSLIRFSDKPTARERDRLQQLIFSGQLAGLPSVRADMFSLYRSHLNERGARYERLVDYPLDGPAIPALEKVGYDRDGDA